jgi:phage/plasmid-like protein (TIGR03299 family)
MTAAVTDPITDAVITEGQEDQPAAIAPAPAPYQPRTSFTLRDVPWGKVGTVIDGGAKTALEAAKLGGMNFKVLLVEAGFKSPKAEASKKGSAWKSISTRRTAIREDTETFFDFVSADYVPVQYAEAFAFMDGINPNYVAAGTMSGGKQAFIVAEMPGMTTLDLEVAGEVDRHKVYGILRTSHDRSKALEVAVLTLRDKCMNAITLSSFTAGAKQRWSIRHVGDPLAKLQQARTSLVRTEVYLEELKKTARSLGEIDLLLDDAQEVLKRVLPDRPKRDEQITAITDAWRHDPTIGEAFANTGWGLVQAVNGYYEWGRNEGTRTAASRFTGALNGATHKYTDRTAQLLLRRR